MEKGFNREQEHWLDWTCVRQSILVYGGRSTTRTCWHILYFGGTLSLWLFTFINPTYLSLHTSLASWFFVGTTMVEASSVLARCGFGKWLRTLMSLRSIERWIPFNQSTVPRFQNQSMKTTLGPGGRTFFKLGKTEAPPLQLPSEKLSIFPLKLLSEKR